MTLTRAAVLRPGDWVAFDGGEYQVLAAAGTSVRLRSTNGRETVVLAAYLIAAPEFVLIDAAPLPPIEPIGLFDALPVAVRDEACAWERHIVEVETGLPPGATVGTIPRRGYDPASTTLAELAGVSEKQVCAYLKAAGAGHNGGAAQNAGAGPSGGAAQNAAAAQTSDAAQPGQSDPAALAAGELVGGSSYLQTVTLNDVFT
jgi:hypothetical protein